MIKEAIEKAAKNIDLTGAEMREAFEEIMSGSSAHADIVEFLVALEKKGETVDEITAAAKVMREKALKIEVGGDLIDTCGTGGSGKDTFNISTAAAFVIAGAGLKVAKHGNRGVSSPCGSADVLEALGVRIGIDADMAAMCIREVGIGFLFAPSFHTAMKYAIAPRKEIGHKTIFNILGPLSNPAGAVYQVIGVYDGKLTETIAGVLKNLRLKRAFVVHGADGLDEITVTAETKVTELRSGRIKTYHISPEEFGIERSGMGDIKGGDVKENAEILSSVLKSVSGPRRDIVLLNAGAALVCGGIARDFREGIRLAAESIDSGKAFDKLLKLIAVTNRN